jgi:N-acyl homoserine lactone hydrolase
MNTSAEQTQASLTRVADLLVEKKALLWINHDNPQSSSQRHSPEFYE